MPILDCKRLFNKVVCEACNWLYFELDAREATYLQEALGSYQKEPIFSALEI